MNIFEATVWVINIFQVTKRVMKRPMSLSVLWKDPCH